MESVKHCNNCENRASQSNKRKLMNFKEIMIYLRILQTNKKDDKIFVLSDMKF